LTDEPELPVINEIFSSFVICATRAVAFAYASAQSPRSTFPEDNSPSVDEVVLEEVVFCARVALANRRHPTKGKTKFFMAKRYYLLGPRRKEADESNGYTMSD